MNIWYILWSFGIVVVFWYDFSRFGKFYREKSGNPVTGGGKKIARPKENANRF
jgi:hypothetical protein